MNSVGERIESGYDDVVALVDFSRQNPEERVRLARFLDERSLCYVGRGTSEVDQLRGYILGAFAAIGMPCEALPYVLEELETGTDPYSVAGAARALRGCDVRSIPAEAESLLLSAISRIKSNDRYVAFKRFGSSNGLDGSDTALTEVIRTMAWLGSLAASTVRKLEEWVDDRAGAFSGSVLAEMSTCLRQTRTLPDMSKAPCCSSKEVIHQRFDVVDAVGQAWNLEVEDQDGSQFKIGDLLLGRPFVLTFFYTRCMNPEKCSLTIAKLAKLQASLGQQRASACTIAAVTYDPEFDAPFRLATYGRDRGLIFGERVRMLRTVGPIEPLVSYLDLAVGFGPATVNRHRSEVLIFDESGQHIFACRRRAWDPQEILIVLQRLIDR